MPASPTPPDELSLPSPEIRGWVGLFLFIHLFIVAAVLSAYANPSPLQDRLRSVLAPYAATLNFDLNPNAFPSGRYYLTHDLPVDYGFLIEIEGTKPDGSTETITLPPDDLWPGERRRHYQALTAAMGVLNGNDQFEAILPSAVGGGILKQQGLERGLVRIKGIRPENVASSDPKVRDPRDARYYVTLYEAHVLVAPNGDVSLVKKSSAAEVAPVEKGGK